MGLASRSPARGLYTHIVRTAQIGHTTSVRRRRSYASRVLRRRALAHGLPRAIARVPGLKRLPVLKLLAIGELALVARRHLQHLDPAQRRRLAELVRRGRGLSAVEREELRGLVAMLDPRAFAGSAVGHLSPVPLPKRLTGARY